MCGPSGQRGPQSTGDGSPKLKFSQKCGVFAFKKYPLVLVWPVDYRVQSTVSGPSIADDPCAGCYPGGDDAKEGQLGAVRHGDHDDPVGPSLTHPKDPLLNSAQPPSPVVLGRVDVRLVNLDDLIRTTELHGGEVVPAPVLVDVADEIVLK